MQKLKYILSVLAVILILWFVYSTTYIQAEPKAYDYMMKNVVTNKLPFDKWKNVTGHDDIVLVMVDADTIQNYRWPWKREMWCKILNYLNDYAEPKVVIFDFIVTTLDKDNPKSDEKFFNSISKIKNFTGAFYNQVANYEDEKFGEKYDKLFVEKYAIKADTNSDHPSIYSSIIPSPKEYTDVVKNAGSVVIMPGFISGDLAPNRYDKVYRNQEPLIYYKGSTLLSLAFSAFMLSNNNPEVTYDNKYIKFPELNYKIKYKDSGYQMMIPIKFYKMISNSQYSHTKVSALEVMNSYDKIQKGEKSLINPEIFKDKVVFIGICLPAGNSNSDAHSTPMSPSHAGTDVLATSYDNIAHNDFLKIAPDYVNILIALIGMLFIYLIIRLNDLFKSISYSILFIIGYFLFSCICYYFGVVINIITPVVMFVITMIMGYTHKFILENRSKEKVKSAMGKYMSQDVMKRVIQNIDNLGLGGKKATVTVLFSDIRGFTSMSEKMTAVEVSEILNEYFTEIEPIITKYNGIINKFIGDAVMAIFGEPIQDKNHASNAVRCGYEMLEKVKELHKKWAEEGKPLIEIGVGVNTGEVFVGNIGSANRMEYTVIGDTVNLASRLESYNKVYKTKMLISSTTYEETKGILDVIKISDVEIRGKANKMDIYEVLKIVNRGG